MGGKDGGKKSRRIQASHNVKNDPIADAGNDDLGDVGLKQDDIPIHLQQRNREKPVTTMQELPKDRIETSSGIQASYNAENDPIVDAGDDDLGDAVTTMQELPKALQALVLVDPIADAGDDDLGDVGLKQDDIHIRGQQRNRKKPVTTTQELPKDRIETTSSEIQASYNVKIDPFADAGDDELGDVGLKQDYIHIRVQQRNRNKAVTTMQGLPKEYDPYKLIKAFKKEFACNGAVIENKDHGQIIQLSGDKRNKVASFLVEEGFPLSRIKVHGH